MLPRYRLASQAQRAAATSLGYDEGAWNAELEEMQEDDEAQGQPAPAPPAPAPAPEPAPVPAPASDGPSEEGWGSVGAAATVSSLWHLSALVCACHPIGCASD